MKERCVVLLSGGLDSAVCVAIAHSHDLQVHALTIDYGQTNRNEVQAAFDLVNGMDIWNHMIVSLPLRFIRSPMTGYGEIPKNRTEEQRTTGISPTYIPGRNLIFLSLAAAWAESLLAKSIYVGFNCPGGIGHPDCRSEFVDLTLQAIQKGSQYPVERICTPLIHLNKKQIVKLAREMNVPIELTTSCYSPVQGKACHACDACIAREEALTSNEG